MTVAQSLSYLSRLRIARLTRCMLFLTTCSSTPVPRLLGQLSLLGMNTRKGSHGQDDGVEQVVSCYDGNINYLLRCLCSMP